MKNIENNYYIARYSNTEYVIYYIIYVNEFKDEYTTVSLYDGEDLVIYKNLHKNASVNSRLKPFDRKLTPLEMIIYQNDINRIKEKLYDMGYL